MREVRVSRRKPAPHYITLTDILHDRAMGPVRIGASLMDVVSAVGMPDSMWFADEAHWRMGFGVVHINVSSLSGAPLVETCGFELIRLRARGLDPRNMPFSDTATWSPSPSLRVRMPAREKRTVPAIRRMLEEERLGYSFEMDLPVGEEVGDVLIANEQVSLYFDRRGALREVWLGERFEVNDYPDFLAIRSLLKRRWPLPDNNDPWSFRRYNDVAWGLRRVLTERKSTAEIAGKLEYYGKRFEAVLTRSEIRGIVADLRRIKTKKFE